jgi:hypothetical protein
MIIWRAGMGCLIAFIAALNIEVLVQLVVGAPPYWIWVQVFGVVILVGAIAGFARAVHKQGPLPPSA